jgi:hypothetical protein
MSSNRQGAKDNFFLLLCSIFEFVYAGTHLHQALNSTDLVLQYRPNFFGNPLMKPGLSLAKPYFGAHAASVS